MTTRPFHTLYTTNKKANMDGNSTSQASKRLATFVAVLTLCAGLVGAQQSHAAGVWTNEPAGASVVMDCSFAGTPSSCGILDVYSSAIQDSDGSSPVSPSGVIRSTLPVNGASGGMQLSVTTPQANREMYAAIVWRTNPQFSCLALADKMWFIRGPGTVGFFGMDCTTGDTTANILFSHNSPIIDNSHTCALDLGLACFPNVNGFRFPLGSWIKLESYVKASTTPTSRDGIVRWWVNGTMVGNYTNMNYGEQGLNEWIWTETWAALQPQFQKSVPLSHYIDHLHISIPNGGGGNTDNPPGPPASPTIRSATTP